MIQDDSSRKWAVGSCIVVPAVALALYGQNVEQPRIERRQLLNTLREERTLPQDVSDHRLRELLTTPETEGEAWRLLLSVIDSTPAAEQYELLQNRILPIVDSVDPMKAGYLRAKYGV